MQVFGTGSAWDAQFPDVLVIACSDGRFQEEVDEFLQNELDIRRYDRLYVPGGAGALWTGGCEFIRAQRFRVECQFLIEAHGIERVILMFHSPAEDGPVEASCGDYMRRLPTASASHLRRQQERDAEQLRRDRLWDGVALEIYRSEVTSGGVVRFVPMRG
jgi:hypothetical protein